MLISGQSGRPFQLMGTKSVAELIFQGHGERYNSTRYMRCGLEGLQQRIGVPRFLQQIMSAERHGDTPEIQRYFMLISEAVPLCVMPQRLEQRSAVKFSRLESNQLVDGAQLNKYRGLLMMKRLRSALSASAGENFRIVNQWDELSTPPGKGTHVRIGPSENRQSHAHVLLP